MQISVVIPVYKAEAFLQTAVESALNQPETGEILLVEDNSPDGSLAVCRALAGSHEKVRLLRHPNGENRGAGASRNLGIRQAQYDYIAFLDADDFYLPARFDFPRKCFNSNPEIDGVYEAVGVHFDNEKVRQRWFLSGGKALTTLSEKVAPEHLFDVLVNGGKGHIHLDGLVVRKRIFDRCGYFHENLRLDQDTAMTFQMAETGILVAGRLDIPVAMRRRHDGNRYSHAAKNRAATAVKLTRTMLWWVIQNDSDRKKIDLFAFQYWYQSAKLIVNPLAGPGEWVKNLAALLYFISRHPLIAGKSLFEFRGRYVKKRQQLELV